MRLCDLCDISFDMNLGKISAKDFEGAGQPRVWDASQSSWAIEWLQSQHNKEERLRRLLTRLLEHLSQVIRHHKASTIRLRESNSQEELPALKSRRRRRLIPQSFRFRKASGHFDDH
jgi:hypothetical protein